MREAGAHGFWAYGTIGDEPANKIRVRAKLSTNRQNHAYVCSFSTVIHGGHSPETFATRVVLLKVLHRRWKLGFGGK